MDQSDHDHQSAAASENPSDGEDYQGASTVTSKSYECNFCRRGFSNAQALGGHMNIHRKDKAKLKQQQSLDKVPPPQNHQDKAKWNWNVSQEEQHASNRTIHTKQLPLFVESPTITETQKPQQDHSTTQPALLPTQDSPLELDLELRLGPEPQDSSSTGETGTRNFF